MAKKALVCLLILVLSVSLLVTACAKSAPAPQTIKIGGAVPLTGRVANGGTQSKDGYELAVEHINADGGVYVKEFGKKIPIELFLLDDESDPVKTVSRLETLYSAQNVDVYLGGAGSFLHAAAAGIAEKNKVPYIGVAFSLNAIHQQGYTYLFSPYVKTPAHSSAFFDALDHVVGAQKPKIAILVRSDDWGAETSTIYSAEAAKRGYEVVINEKYSPAIKDFTPLILKAKAAGAEVLLGEPIEPHGIAIIKQMKELDWNVKFIGWVRAPSASTFGEALGELSDYVLGSESWHPDATWPGNARLVADYNQKHGKDPAVVVGAAYASIQIVADAIERAGTLDRDSIRDAMAATDMMTVEGPIKFRADGTSTAISHGYQWIDNKLVLVWPWDMAKAEIVYPMPKWSER